MGYSQCNRDFAERFVDNAAGNLLVVVVVVVVVGIQLIRFEVRVRMASGTAMILGSRSIRLLGLVQMIEMVLVLTQWVEYHRCQSVPVDYHADYHAAAFLGRQFPAVLVLRHSSCHD